MDCLDVIFIQLKGGIVLKYSYIQMLYLLHKNTDFLINIKIKIKHIYYLFGFCIYFNGFTDIKKQLDFPNQ